MVRKNTSLTAKKLVVRLLTAIFIISSLSTQSRAQLTQGYQVSIKFPPVADRGAPERTAPGGRRGGCDLDNLAQEATPSDTNTSKIKITAIAPINNITTSVAPNPSVYVHIPTITDTQVKFSVLEQKTKTEVYNTNFLLSHTAGIVKVNLPEAVKLQPHKIYTWEFLVICDPEDSSDDKLARGWLERIAITSEQLEEVKQLQHKPIEQAKLYAKFGAWYETLEILASLRENPQSKTEWDELLESVKLQQLVNASVTDCCKVPNSPTIPTNSNNSEKLKPTSAQNTELRGN
ncbi:DUF928 domain-containing protein [Anabaena sphaerica FACHB-251]|uniref:DUF928 domain-containing protein n=1 Tax=Anabaena sphaerica FACHB-251 TaxID=2692883 RepID=A0A927A0U2_9NOST|nr:DUF928 domain-containing protein [Anabaena sphaerica]MBD2293899.1 DUF928 domain-containing protein [Anabaena sphaerica FACHB-251]